MSLIWIIVMPSWLDSLLLPLLPCSQFQKSSQADSNRVIIQHVLFLKDSLVYSKSSNGFSSLHRVKVIVACSALPVLWLLFPSLSSSLCSCYTGLSWCPCDLTLPSSGPCSNVAFSSVTKVVKSSLITLFRTDACLLPWHPSLYFISLCYSPFYILYIFYTFIF